VGKEECVAVRSQGANQIWLRESRVVDWDGIVVGGQEFKSLHFGFEIGVGVGFE
jgi:hypothetical protein